MNLHGEIMSIQVPNDIMGSIEKSSEGFSEIRASIHKMGTGEKFDRVMAIAYKIGHRDARHAAAELAVTHDA